MKRNHLRQLLRNGGRGIGVWAMLGSEVTIEVAAQLGYDWVLIDCEHGIAGLEEALRLLRPTAGYEISSVVRVPTAHDPAVFKRVLDMGAEGVLAPLIREAPEVRQVVSACRYPPQGTRGIAPQRAHGYGIDFSDYFGRANEEILVIVQIETKEAVENVDEIAAIEGLDALLVGPADLSAALGAPFDTRAQPFGQAIDRILEATARVGKAAGIYCHSPEDARSWLERGFRFVNICNDQSLLVEGLQKALGEMNQPSDAG